MSTQPPTSHESADDVPGEIFLGHPPRNVYQVIRLLAQGAAAVLILTFSWLELKEATYKPLKDIPDDSITRLALALYYAGWVAGVMTDTSVQERTYSVPPNKGHMPLSGFVSALALSVGFGALCFLTGSSAGRFAVLLAAFLIINIATWRYMVDKVLPGTVARSKKDFEGDPIRSERLRLVYSGYLAGRWQWARYGAGAVGIGVICGAILSNKKPVVVASAILGYVLLMEGWIWLVRPRLGASLQVLDYMGRRYSLAPRAPVQITPPDQPLPSVAT